MAKKQKIRRVSFLPEQMENFEREKVSEKPMEFEKIEIPFAEINEKLSGEEEFITEKIEQPEFHFSIADFLNQFGIHFFDNFPTANRRRSTMSAIHKEDNKVDELYNRVVLEEQVGILEQFCSDLENEIANLRSRSQNAENEINSCKKTANSLFHMKNEEAKNILIYLRKICRNQAKSGLLKISIAEQEKYNLQLCNKKDALEKKLDENRRTGGEMKKIMQKLNEEHEKIKNNLHNLRKIKNIERQPDKPIEILQAENKKLKREVDAMRSENKILITEIQQKETAKVNLEGEGKILQGDIEQLQKELNKKSIEPVELMRLKEFAEASCKSLDLKVENFKEDIFFTVWPFSLKQIENGFEIVSVEEKCKNLKHLLTDKYYSINRIMQLSFYFEVLLFMQENRKLTESELKEIKEEEIIEYVKNFKLCA